MTDNSESFREFLRQTVPTKRDEVEVQRSLLTKILGTQEAVSSGTGGEMSVYIGVEVALTQDEAELVEKIRGRLT